MKFACMDCGTNYESPITCCCHSCGSGMLNQLNMDDVQVFGKKSQGHKVTKFNQITFTVLKKLVYALSLLTIPSTNTRLLRTTNNHL